MAYTPYQPYFANPYGFQPMPMQNSTPVPSVQQTPAPQSNSGLIWVQGEAGAKSYFVAAGQTVMLMDSEESRFFLKSSDASGMPLPLRVFTYSEQIGENGAKMPSNAPDMSAKEFVTRDEYNGLKAEIERLQAQFCENSAKSKVKTAKESVDNA